MNTRSGAVWALPLSLLLSACDSSSVSGCLGPLCFIGSNNSDCNDIGHCLCPAAHDLDLDLAQALSDLRNSARQCGNVFNASAPAMSWNATLDAAATDHADDMRAFGFTDPIGSDGLSVANRVAAVAPLGFRYDQTLVQLVADGEPSLDRVLDHWLATPASCNSLMSTNLSHAGIACAGNSSVIAREVNRWSLVLGGE
ncbi:MAG: CAP domain-containing protein [Pseudomonadota bacterium]